MKMNLQTVGFAADAIRMLNGARLSVNGLYSIAVVDWLIAAGINFRSTTAFRFAHLEGLPSNNNGSNKSKTFAGLENESW